MLQACSRLMPRGRASRTTQSRPNMQEIVGVAVVGADADALVRGRRVR